jgi:hypothetical protein
MSIQPVSFPLHRFTDQSSGSKTLPVSYTLIRSGVNGYLVLRGMRQKSVNIQSRHVTPEKNESSDVIRKNLRACDSAFRYGGEEFTQNRWS